MCHHGCAHGYVSTAVGQCDVQAKAEEQQSQAQAQKKVQCPDTIIVPLHNLYLLDYACQNSV